MTRRTPALRAALALAVFSASTGCFSPNVSSEDGTEGGSGGSAETTAVPTTTAAATTATTMSATTDEPTTGTSGPTTTEADETGADLPPVIDSFTVDGSTRPAEVSTAGTVLLEVDASDDEGIAMVEFFDGEESLAAIKGGDSLELLLTSADSGSHTYRAVVTDTAGQTAESEEVTLSVNIVGGQIEILREELFTGSDFLGFVNGSIAVPDADHVYVTARRPDLDGYTIAFSPDLSQLWAQPSDPQNAPAVRLDGNVVLPEYDEDALSWSYRVVNPDTGATLDEFLFSLNGESQDDLALGPFAAATGDDLILFTSPDSFARYDASLDAPVWSRDLPFATSTFGNFAPAPDGGVVAGVLSEDCAPGATRCVVKVRPDGTTEWTAGLDAVDSFLVAAPTPDGGAIAAGRAGDGCVVARIGSRGTLGQTVMFPLGDLTTITEIAADGQGGAVISGNVGYNDGEAFVMRVDAELNEIWRQSDFFFNTDSLAISAAVDGGAVYVLGLETLASDTLFGLTGAAWAARLKL